MDEFFDVAWLLVGGVWLVAGRWREPTVRRQGAPALVHGGLLLAAYVLLFGRWRAGPLVERVLGAGRTEIAAGLLLTAVGAALAIWARVTIGRNWSGVVTIKEGHRQVREGPYRPVRHPIYTGLLLAMAGTALGRGTLAAVLSVPVAFAAFWTKLRVEERFMRERFGDEYVGYQREVKALAPWVL